MVDEPVEAPVSQQRVVTYYQEEGHATGTVGEYVRVDMSNSSGVTCFGPSEDLPMLGWMVVEIDWNAPSMLLAPVDAVYGAELFDDGEVEVGDA